MPPVIAKTVNKYEKDVPIDVKGEVTGDTFKGKFKFRTRLSHRDRATQDILRREYLGPQPVGAIASARAAQQALIFSELDVRIIEAPSWWTTASNGQDLFDDDVVATIYDAAIGAEKEAKEALLADAEAKKTDLETDPPAQP